MIVIINNFTLVFVQNIQLAWSVKNQEATTTRSLDDLVRNLSSKTKIFKSPLSTKKSDKISNRSVKVLLLLLVTDIEKYIA